jgi:Spy/CpxP family protein refolding chaperone
MRTILLLTMMLASTAWLCACANQQTANGKTQQNSPVASFGAGGGGGGGY